MKTASISIITNLNGKNGFEALSVGEGLGEV
jgi:hypothetical protein